MKVVAQWVTVCAAAVVVGIVLSNIIYDVWFAPPPAPSPYVQNALMVESATLYAVPIVLSNGTYLWIGAIAVEDGYQTWMADDKGLLLLSRRASLSLAKEDLSIVQATVLAEKNSVEEIRPILDSFKASGGAPRRLTLEQEAIIYTVVRGDDQQTESNYRPLAVAKLKRG